MLTLTPTLTSTLTLSLTLTLLLGLTVSVDSGAGKLMDKNQNLILEIWGKAQRESARRPKSDWGKLGGEG